MIVNTCTLSDWMFSFIEYKEKLFLKLKIYYVTFIKVQQVFWIEKQDKKKTTRFDLARLQNNTLFHTIWDYLHIYFSGEFNYRNIIY